MTIEHASPQAELTRNDGNAQVCGRSQPARQKKAVESEEERRGRTARLLLIDSLDRNCRSPCSLQSCAPGLHASSGMARRGVSSRQV